MPRARYYHARDSISSLLKTSSSSALLYVIPENITTDDLLFTGSSAAVTSSHDQPDSTLTRRCSWIAGDDSIWTAQDVCQPTGSIATGAPETRWPSITRAVRKSRPLPLNAKRHNEPRPRPASLTFADFFGGTFQPPFTANNPSGLEPITSSATDGPYPVRSRNNKRMSWG